MRGEKPHLWISFGGKVGSPPHARGKVIAPDAVYTVKRITPACAGKRVAFPSRLHRTKDHPRMRGEKRSGELKSAGDVGSPPHARGKEQTGSTGRVDGRITPACAGKSFQRADSFTIPWDHPRMRGEKRKS